MLRWAAQEGEKGERRWGMRGCLRTRVQSQFLQISGRPKIKVTGSATIYHINMIYTDLPFETLRIVGWLPAPGPRSIGEDK